MPQRPRTSTRSRRSCSSRPSRSLTPPFRMHLFFFFSFFRLTDGHHDSAHETKLKSGTLTMLGEKQTVNEISSLQKGKKQLEEYARLSPFFFSCFFWTLTHFFFFPFDVQDFGKAPRRSTYRRRVRSAGRQTCCPRVCTERPRRQGQARTFILFHFLTRSIN